MVQNGVVLPLATMPAVPSQGRSGAECQATPLPHVSEEESFLFLVKGFTPQEDVTKHFSELPAAGERSPQFQGCSQTHGGGEALQIPEKAFPFPANGLRVCWLADALPVHFPAEGLSELSLPKADEGPVG